MTEKVTLAHLYRVRRMAKDRGNKEEVKRLTLAINMKEGKYPENQRHPK